MAVLTEGSIDKNAIAVGDWSEVAVQYPALTGSWYFLGNCPEGVLEVSKEDYLHEGTNFPRRIDLVIPVRAGMKFSCQVEELFAQNLKLIVGQAPDEANPYTYLGGLTVPTYFTFRARRNRNSDLATTTVIMWKAQVTGLMSIGGGDEAVSSPLEVIALDDSGGDYGGSSTAPLGYIHAPIKSV